MSVETATSGAVVAPTTRRLNVAILVLLLVAIALLGALVAPDWINGMARARLEATPAAFIEPGGWTRFDKGILNTYTRATTIEFTNTSEFDVTDLSGTITYVSRSGDTMAEVPFQAEGELQAGATATLPVTAGEISGAAADARIRVERVRVRR